MNMARLSVGDAESSTGLSPFGSVPSEKRSTPGCVQGCRPVSPAAPLLTLLQPANDAANANSTTAHAAFRMTRPSFLGGLRYADWRSTPVPASPLQLQVHFSGGVQVVL